LYSGKHTSPTEEDGFWPLHGYGSFVSLVMEAQAANANLTSWLPVDMNSHQVAEMVAFDHQAVSAVRSKVTEANETLQQIIDDIPTLSASEDDTFLPSLPPRALVEPSINEYFKKLNPRLPIFSRQTIRDAVESQYTIRTGPPDLVWITSFNCIVLQALTQTSIANKVVGGTEQDIPLDYMIISLLRNIRQCYNRLETLVKPRLSNIRALFCLVRLTTLPLERGLTLLY
jgi:hypothetical protein